MCAVSGVYAALITPRREGPEIDLAAAFELVDFVSKAGVAGIVLMGATGEFPHFTLEERGRLVALAVKRSRVPVIAGVGHSTFDGALMLAREAGDAGVVVGLVWGIISLILFGMRAFTAESFDYSPEVPE